MAGNQWQTRSRRPSGGAASLLPGLFRRRSGIGVYGVDPRSVAAVVQLLGVVTIFLVLIWILRYRGGVAWNTTNKILIFNIHPVLMLVGYLYFSSQAMLIYKTGNGSKRNRKGWHLLLQLLALVLGAIGIWAAFRHHNESTPPIDNLYTLHSWLGMAAAVLFAVQWMAGFYTYWYPGGSSSVRSAYMPWHVFGGLFIYCLGLAATETGILEKLTFLQVKGLVGHYDLEPLIANSLGLIVAILGGLVILAAVIPDAVKEKTYAPLH